MTQMGARNMMSINNRGLGQTPRLARLLRPKLIQFPWHTASAANASGSLQTTLSKLPPPHGPAHPHIFAWGSPDRDLSFVGTNPEALLPDCPSSAQNRRQALIELARYARGAFRFDAALL